MIPIEEILSIRTPEEFSAKALTLFRFQAEWCAPYRNCLRLIGVDPAGVDAIEKVPFLPIELFKSHRVYCGADEPEAVFTSSTTGGTTPSRHYIERLSNYERTFQAGFTHFYGRPEDYTFFALLPSYLERSGSSLVYMAQGLIDAGGGDFYMGDYARLVADMERTSGPKILLGVSYALWELAERHAPKLSETIVMETGGMKGRREELPKEAFHALLCEAFGVERIHSEYGMAELSSQAYSAGGGIFRTPPWMRVLVRDPNDPFDVRGAGPEGVSDATSESVSGGINIIDLANGSSCAFIQTQDLGRLRADGNFEVLGRADRSEIRGCNLLIQ